MCAYQYLFMVILFSGGPPFRKMFYTNVGFTATFLVLFTCTCLIHLLSGGWSEEFFELMPFPFSGAPVSASACASPGGCSVL